METIALIRWTIGAALVGVQKFATGGLKNGATLGMMDKRGRDGPAKDAGWAIGAGPLVGGITDTDTEPE